MLRNKWNRHRNRTLSLKWPDPRIWCSYSLFFNNILKCYKINLLSSNAMFLCLYQNYFMLQLLRYWDNNTCTLAKKCLKNPWNDIYTHIAHTRYMIGINWHISSITSSIQITKICFEVQVHRKCMSIICLFL